MSHVLIFWTLILKIQTLCHLSASVTRILGEFFRTMGAQHFTVCIIFVKKMSTASTNTIALDFRVTLSNVKTLSRLAVQHYVTVQKTSLIPSRWSPVDLQFRLTIFVREGAFLQLLFFVLSWDSGDLWSKMMFKPIQNSSRWTADGIARSKQQSRGNLWNTCSVLSRRSVLAGRQIDWCLVSAMVDGVVIYLPYLPLSSFFSTLFYHFFSYPIAPLLFPSVHTCVILHTPNEIMLLTFYT
jgi:hypothetical protein